MEQDKDRKRRKNPMDKGNRKKMLGEEREQKGDEEKEDRR